MLWFIEEIIILYVFSCQFKHIWLSMCCWQIRVSQLLLAFLSVAFLAEVLSSTNNKIVCVCLLTYLRPSVWCVQLVTNPTWLLDPSNFTLIQLSSILGKVMLDTLFLESYIFERIVSISFIFFLTLINILIIDIH